MSAVTALLICAATGLLDLPVPFAGDQALFCLGARAIDRGAVLYRDFWDLKQPGIYWFYLIAGRLFGFDSVGIHLAEVLWFLLLAVVICFGLRWRTGGAPALTAALTVGVYFSLCRSWHLTQLEGLVWLPLTASLLLVIRVDVSRPVTRSRWFAYGAMIAAVGLFKLLLIAVPLAFAVVALWPRNADDARTVARTTARAFIFTAAGTLSVSLPAAAYFASQHQLGMLWKTFVSDPPRILRQMPAGRTQVLLRSAKWFLIAVSPLLALDAVAVVKPKRPDRYEVALIAWGLVAAGLILVQRMWWEYHFLLVLCPMCLLAAIGFNRLWARLRSTPKSAATRFGLSAALVLLTFGPYAARLISRGRLELQSLTKADPAANFAERTSPSYHPAAVEAAWLDTVSVPNDQAYVLGDPLILYLSHRPQPVPINGWSPEWLLPEQWDELAGQIEAARPGEIFVADENIDILAGNGHAVHRLILSGYQPARASASGVWYRRK